MFCSLVLRKWYVVYMEKNRFKTKLPAPKPKEEAPAESEETAHERTRQISSSHLSAIRGVAKETIAHDAESVENVNRKVLGRRLKAMLAKKKGSTLDDPEQDSNKFHPNFDDGVTGLEEATGGYENAQFDDALKLTRGENPSSIPSPDLEEDESDSHPLGLVRHDALFGGAGSEFDPSDIPDELAKSLDDGVSASDAEESLSVSGIEPISAGRLGAGLEANDDPVGDVGDEVLSSGEEVPAGGFFRNALGASADMIVDVSPDTADEAEDKEFSVSAKRLSESGTYDSIKSSSTEDFESPVFTPAPFTLDGEAAPPYEGVAAEKTAEDEAEAPVEESVSAPVEESVSAPVEESVPAPVEESVEEELEA